MHKIVITITASGLIVNAGEPVLIPINQAGIVAEKIFLKTIMKAKSFCLN